MADHKDFEDTAIPHMSLMRNYALRLTLNVEDSKDLVQDTYLRAYQYWSQFELGSNIRGWLCRIMKNTFINQYRIKGRIPTKVEYDETRFSYDTPQLQLSDGQHRRGKPFDEVFEDEIVRSLESLPVNFRTIVVLSDVEEYSYAEISELIACPVGTVRSRLHRGRKVLQQNLREFAGQNGYFSR